MFGYEGIVTWYQGLKVRWEQEQAKIERQEQEQVRARLKALNCKDEEICKAQARLHRKCEDYEEQIRMAESDKLTTLQGLRDQHTLSLQELHDYFDDKMSQEKNRTNKVEMQGKGERDLLEMVMKQKEELFVEEVEDMQVQLRRCKHFRMPKSNKHKKHAARMWGLTK
uniref:Uncharacterized protein n=1 Tax=Physcomitrium patens TaxID=3218 RepID=A0A2K1J266_PHYPA|nr:hypothetical protein PHYPA_021473 [Physcomitrium patens]